ncbi:MAG TPA: CHAT domain-containing protein [Thermoanaerobaculia bacterium]
MNEPSLPLPDLQIFVRRASSDDERKLSFEARARDPELDLNFRDCGSIQLSTPPEQHIHELVQDVSNLSLETENDREIARYKIEGKGGTLFEGLLPADLQRLLWDLQKKISTLQIVSDDPYIPWELLRLRRREGKRVMEGPFLCEAFAVTRWRRGAVEPSALPLRRFALVFPKTSGLPMTWGEREDLLALHGTEREVTEIPPSYVLVRNALSTGDFDAWHFSGHGATYTKDPNLWDLQLDDQPLRPEDLGSAAGHLGLIRPLLFFNGCHTGRGGWSWAGLGGWPQALLNAGAGAFVGTLWAVGDKKAHAFQKAFYELFLGGQPIGEAVRQARLRVRDEFPGDPAWLAYTVFAHPLTTCGENAALMTQTAPLILPRQSWKEKKDPPGALLRAEFGVVPFHGREEEMEDLRTWCLGEESARIRLYTGPGGMGKTRLALEAARTLRAEGWRTGFLEPEALNSPEEAWTKISRPGGKVLVVVDYAETRRDLLIPLLRGIYATDSGPYRVILLARAALDWWEQLKTERHGVGALLSGPATSRQSLAPLAFAVPERARSYELAANAFSERLAKPYPESLPGNLDADYFERVLLLHMSALIAVDGGKERVKGENGILDQILYRERRHWRERVKGAGLPSTFAKGIGRAMAAITMESGITNEEEAVDILRSLSFFDGQSTDVLIRTARLLHECYPGTRWIEPLLPDLLGEHLIDREMETGEDELFEVTLGPEVR